MGEPSQRHEPEGRLERNPTGERPDPRRLAPGRSGAWRLERVRKADGRYLLYYSWPRADEADAPEPSDV